MFRICPARRVCDSRHGKTACKLLCGGFSFASPVLRPRTFEPNPNLTSLRSSSLGCLPQGRFRKSASLSRVTFRNKKPPANCFAAVFLCVSGLRPRTFEPNPRFELGTPSLRVKCSTAELIRLSTARENFGFVFYRSLRDCKYQKKNFFSQQFCKNSLNSCYIRGKTDPDRCL